MRPHHKKAIQKLKETYECDPRYLSLIIVGSVAAGNEHDTSDVDHILVVTDEEFEQRKMSESVHYWTPDFCDYPGGYVEGKIVDLKFIEDVSIRGSEPARVQFAGAKVVFSKIIGLDKTVEQIALYQEQEREGKIRTFYAHMKVLRDYLNYGEQNNDRYIAIRAASGIALFAGRLILAHNRILYPYHKWFTRQVKNAPEKPPEFDKIFDTFLRNPIIQNCDELCKCIVDFMHLDKYEQGFISRFVMDTEWNWRHGRGPVEDW